MNRRTASILAALIATLGLAAVLAPSAGAAAPAWRVAISSAPTNFIPNYGLNEGKLPEFRVSIVNVGAAPTSGPVNVAVHLGAGITEHGTGDQVVNLGLADFDNGGVDHLEPGSSGSTQFPVDVGPLAVGETVETTVTVSGGGASSSARASTTTAITAPSPTFSAPPPFEFLPGPDGLSGSVTDPDGFPVTQAADHPYQLGWDLGLPMQQVGTSGTALIGVEGSMRDLATTLPRGMVLNPAATQVRCTEAQFESLSSCPASAAIGAVSVSVPFVGGAGFLVTSDPLFNMVPAAGEAAHFAVEVGGIGLSAHLSGGVRAGDYALEATTEDTLAHLAAQIATVSVQLWGDPTDPAHDAARTPDGHGHVSVPPSSSPLLSAPSECRGSQSLEVDADSWAKPGIFHHRATPLTDSNGNEIGISGCNALSFAPTLQARPTTNVADSPSGLDFDLHVPQTENLNQLSTAHLRKAVVTLPSGLVLNPSGANGLDACTPEQIGIDAGTGVPNGNPIACPDASKVGTVEVDTPLLPNPLVGAAYVAKPYDNPFDSLLALYVAVNDPQTGVLIKLAGSAVADPNTGRLTATFDENPQLPFSDFKIAFFGGAHGLLRTPSTCGSYSTTSQMTPWSYPDSGPPATPHDDHSISQGPGGTCASNESALPNSPGFDSGSASPIAAKSAPFVLHLRRNDGTQYFSAVNVSPPPGLTAKLAGTDPCSDAALAAAAQKSGRQEQASPSCPASSEVGSFTVGAGAGPSPYYVPGKVYLTGPYKGAPLSFAFVTPAVGGPYDLGTVVTKAAVYVDSSTGRVSTVSDPLPTILQGIPLDVRSVDVSLDRPDFTRNGTSCDPLSVDGQLTSTLGQVAPLAERFQLGECVSLAFKPKLGIRLFGGTGRGAHPALRGIVQMPVGGANIAKASVALPHSEFLDQGHIGTVCTRVQFAEGGGNGASCPAASIYGHAVATSPLVGYALEGNAYLRSSSHELPDLVVALHGPPSQPIAVNVVGRIDSVKGGIRTTFEGVPDLPVSSFVLSTPGGKKGLLQNSTNICTGTHKATAEFDAQNGDTADLTPELKNGKCGKAKKKHRRHGRAARAVR